MILSASRRTDIPNYYSEWFYNRLKEGFLYVRNPRNQHQVSRITLSPEVVDCIVFWTKNPAPMLERMDELADYNYYFQFTLTGYGREIECHVPRKRETLIPVFQELSRRIGAERVIWRYDPIIFTPTYTPEYHQHAFGQIATALEGYTEKCVISFVDRYAKNKKRMEQLGVYGLEKEELLEFASGLSRTAQDHGFEIGSCAERIDLRQCGIEHNCCIDKNLIEHIIGCKIIGNKDINQRSECGCMESVEIGIYDTCLNGCKYCYANGSEKKVAEVFGRYDPDSPILCGRIGEYDRITERKMKSCKDSQIHLFDILIDTEIPAER